MLLSIISITSGITGYVCGHRAPHFEKHCITEKTDAPCVIPQLVKEVSQRRQTPGKLADSFSDIALLVGIANPRLSSKAL
ncbi:hypothetical protein TNCV_1155261 [Trichonephila clavipes]|nr:hypothetical protein TNCV_1155261 [Trichonephila clavipes]